MGWMLLLCLRFRTRWRMSSRFVLPLGGVAGGFSVAPPVVWGLLFLECDVLWRQG
jgi:hypothetical protein